MRVGNIVGTVALVVLGLLMILSVRSTSTSEAGSTATTVFVWQTTSVPAESSTSSEPPTSVATPPTPSTSPPTSTSPPSPITTPATTAGSLEPASVSIRVLNGGAAPGAGQYVTAILEKAGYRPLSPADTSSTVDRHTVLYAAGRREEAVAAAAAMNIPTGQVTEADPADANWQDYGASLDVLVVLGPA